MAFNAPVYGGYGAIGGALPFNGNSVSGFASGNPGEIAANYQQAYNNALGMNSANYANILRGYQQALSAQTTAQQAIQAGYSNLYNEVIGKVSGIGQARTNAINDDSARNLAGLSQQLIDRGLGNTTVQQSVARGVEGDRTRRLVENDESVARMLGDYMSSLGLAGLRSSEQGVNNLTGLNLRQLDFMNSVTARYPDAGLYAGLAQQAGRNQGGYGGGAFAGGGAGPRVGYVPGGYYQAGGGYFGPQATGGGGGSWLASQYGAPSSAGMWDNYYGGGGSGVFGDVSAAGSAMFGGALAAAAAPSGGGFFGNMADTIASGMGGQYGGGGDFGGWAGGGRFDASNDAEAYAPSDYGDSSWFEGW